MKSCPEEMDEVVPGRDVLRILRVLEIKIS